MARTAPAKPAPGAVERAAAAHDSAGLLARYDSTLTAHPALAGRLGPLRAEVARHVTAFGGRAAASPGTAAVGGTAGSTAGAGPTASGAGQSTATAPASPAADPRQALAALATAERELADRRAGALLAVPGDLARLLASVAAAGAGHVVLLGSGAEKA